MRGGREERKGPMRRRKEVHVVTEMSRERMLGSMSEKADGTRQNKGMKFWFEEVSL